MRSIARLISKNGKKNMNYLYTNYVKSMKMKKTNYKGMISVLTFIPKVVWLFVDKTRTVNTARMAL